MVVGEAYYPSVNMNEMYRLQPTLANLRSTFTLVLLSAIEIAEVIGYVSPLRSMSCLFLNHHRLSYFRRVRTRWIDHGCDVSAHA